MLERETIKALAYSCPMDAHWQVALPLRVLKQLMALALICTPLDKSTHCFPTSLSCPSAEIPHLEVGLRHCCLVHSPSKKKVPNIFLPALFKAGNSTWHPAHVHS